MHLTFLMYSKLPYDVTPEQAMSHEEVRTRLEASIKNMRTVTDKFLSAIVVSVDKIPWVLISDRFWVYSMCDLFIYSAPALARLSHCK